MKGPSVTLSSPSFFRTVVAAREGWSPSPPTIRPASLCSPHHFMTASYPAFISSGLERPYHSSLPTNISMYFTFGPPRALLTSHDERAARASTLDCRGDSSGGRPAGADRPAGAADRPGERPGPPRRRDGG